MIKRAFSTKYVRTALFSQCPIMKFSKSHSKYDTIFDEYKIGHVFKFTALYNHTAMSFENIQNIIVFWYLIDIKLHANEIEFDSLELLMCTAYEFLSKSNSSIIK